MKCSLGGKISRQKSQILFAWKIFKIFAFVNIQQSIFTFARWKCLVFSTIYILLSHICDGSYTMKSNHSRCNLTALFTSIHFPNRCAYFDLFDARNDFLNVGKTATLKWFFTKENYSQNVKYSSFLSKTILHFSSE